MTAQRAIDILREHGWKFIDDERATLRKGWWVLPTAGDARSMRRGDPQPYAQAAVDTAELYVEAIAR